MKKRNANLIFDKNGNGFDTIKISLPLNWIKSLGFTKEDRNAVISFEDNKITIEKGEFKMFRIIKFYDVYREDLLKKYGSKKYDYYGDFNTTTYETINEFRNKKDAIEFVEKFYNSLRDDEKFSKSGNDIYLTRIDVLNYEDEDDPIYVESFGLSLEEYENL